jgi:hypothetical protein
MKKPIMVAKEFYEAMENLKHDPSFIRFKEEVVDRELDRLAEKILTADTVSKAGQANALSDIRLYQRTIAQYQTFFDVSEDQAKLIRKQVKQRDKKRKQELA